MHITAKMKTLKALFWSKAKDNPTIDPASVSDADIRDIVGESSLDWLSDPELRAWFLDDRTLDRKLTVGAEEAVDLLIRIVRAKDVGPREAVSSSSQVAAAKLLLDFARLKPSEEKEGKLNPEDLPNDPKKLREYIEKNAKKLTLA